MFFLSIKKYFLNSVSRGVRVIFFGEYLLGKKYRMSANQRVSPTPRIPCYLLQFLYVYARVYYIELFLSFGIIY